MKDHAHIAESIERFRSSFWDRSQGDRPPVAVVPTRTWLPIGYLKAPFGRTHFLPADVTGHLVRTDYEDAAIERKVFADDWLPYKAAWRAIPWLEAICGCPVRYATGSLAPEPCAASATASAETELPANRAWYACLAGLTATLADELPPDCFASPTILRGPSDVLAAMRGLSNFYLDLYDAPASVAHAAARINRLHRELLERHFAAVPPKCGGYGHIYGYWAPGPTHVLQEDVLGMCSPRVYREIFEPLNAELVRQLGPHTLFHLHSTGLRHWQHVLELPGIAGLEITVESNGPRLADLASILRTILERSRLMLYVDAWIEDLPCVLRQVPHEGLYLIIADRYVPGDDDFRACLAEWFPRPG